MYLGGPTFELGGPTFESRVGLFSGEGSSKIRPSPSLSRFYSSPMGVFSRDYGICKRMHWGVDLHAYQGWRQLF